MKTTSKKQPLQKPGHTDYPKSDIPTPGIHIAFIKAELTRAGYTQKLLAEEIGVAQVTINKVLRGKSTSRRVAECIAEKTGLTLEQMWPGVYQDDAVNHERRQHVGGRRAGDRSSKNI